ncbi:MAG TPA: NAD(P)-dependent alcohol dehydrogenase [Streptosporangiaceae bacterium]|nr:NAD(P)-dependent alcohol dehydrogenase [Streptosporangiaceae bacterium]
MKAAVGRRYGSPDAVTVEEVPTPRPGDGEILVRVRAATVGVVDGLARGGSPFYARAQLGPLRPRFPVLGSDFAGVVEAAGRAVTRFGVGDSVFGTVAPRFGAHAEYVCLPSSGAVAPMPTGVSFAEAAALANATALCFLRDKAGLRTGQTILINGASGAVGAAAVQLARHFGASVTGVCSGPHAGLVRKLGAEAVIDYTRTDFTRAGQRYDVIFDVAGKSSFLRCRGALRPGGVYLTTAPSPAIMVQMPWTARFGRTRAVVAFTGLRSAALKRSDLLVLRDLVEKSELSAVIGARFPLERIAEAHARVDAGHKKGNIVVTVA